MRLGEFTFLLYNKKEYISIYLIEWIKKSTKFEIYLSDNNIESMTRESLKLLSQSEIHFYLIKI